MANSEQLSMIDALGLGEQPEPLFIARSVQKIIRGDRVQGIVHWVNNVRGSGILYWAEAMDIALALEERCWRIYDTRHEIEKLVRVGKDWNARHSEASLNDLPDGTFLDMRIIEEESFTLWPEPKKKRTDHQ